MTLEGLFCSRLRSNASKGTFCSEYLLNLTLNPQTTSKYVHRSFPETAFALFNVIHAIVLINQTGKMSNCEKNDPSPSNVR